MNHDPPKTLLSTLANGVVVVMEINQLKPVEVVRDEYGSWIHPEYRKYLDEHHENQEWLSQSEWDAIKRHFNIETVSFYLESCTSMDDWEKMMENADLTDWKPIAPNGFFLMDIHFTEDDAIAVFARPIRETEIA